MPYSPPPSDAIDFDFGVAYAPPSSNDIEFDLTAVGSYKDLVFSFISAANHAAVLSFETLVLSASFSSTADLVANLIMPVDAPLGVFTFNSVSDMYATYWMSYKDMEISFLSRADLAVDTRGSAGWPS